MKKTRIISTIIFTIIILSLFTVIVIDLKKTKKEVLEKYKYQKIVYEKYKYKLDYIYGNTPITIYLLNNDEIGVISEYDEVAKQKGCNCVVHTGKKIYVEKKATYNNDVLKIIIETFKNLSSNNKYIDLTKKDLTSNDTITLLGIIYQDKNLITLNNAIKNIKYERKLIDVLNKENKVLFTNKINIIKITDNIILNKIALFINDSINKDLNSNINGIKDILNPPPEDPSIKNINGLTYEIELYSINDDTISFNYQLSGDLGGVGMYDIKYFEFDLNGEIFKYPVGVEEESKEKAIEEFTKTDIYIKHKDLLNDNWKNILKENIFKIGNYYSNNNKLSFVIDRESLGLDASIPQKITITIKK